MRAYPYLVGLYLFLAACSGGPPDQSRRDGASPNPGAAGSGVENAIANIEDIQPGAGPDAINAGSAAAGGEASAWCAIARARTSEAFCAELAVQRDSLAEGVAAFNPPRQMTLGEPTRVTLPIGAKAERAAVERQAGGAPGEAVSVEIRIGRYMTASLSGSAFDITPVGSPERDLGMSNREDWQWDVKPLAQGAQTLQVEVEAFARDEAGKRTRIELFRSEPIAVDVDVTGEQARKNAIDQASREIGNTTPLLETMTKWLGGLAALILAAGVVKWRLRNFGRRAPDDDQKPE